MSEKDMNEQNPVQKLLAEVLLLAEQQASEKINKAMRLFVECDNIYKGIILLELRPKLPLTAKTLRDCFDTLDIVGDLDNLIDDMQYDIDARKQDAMLEARKL